MPTPWNADPASSAPRIRRNATRTLRLVKQHAQAGNPPQISAAQEWHRELYKGVPLPVDYYAGEIRDSDPRFPELIDYEVQVGGAVGVPAREVPAALTSFETAVQTAVGRLDQGIGVGVKPATVSDLNSALLLASITHGEWARIHPFANGNGRTARLWGNWTLLRYGLPAVLRVKPRPAGSDYARAASLSMIGDHDPMFALILQELQART